jgi:hypothetical protein
MATTEEWSSSVGAKLLKNPPDDLPVVAPMPIARINAFLSALGIGDNRLSCIYGGVAYDISYIKAVTVPFGFGVKPQPTNAANGG